MEGEGYRLPFSEGRYYPPLREDDDYPYTRGHMMGLMHRSSGSAIWIIVAGCVILPIVPLLAFIMAALGIAIGLYTVDEDSSLSIPALVSGIILGILSFMLAYMNFTLFSYW